MAKDLSQSNSSDVFLSDLSHQDKPWDGHRENASSVAGLYRQAGIDARANRMDDCAKQLWFALQASEHGELRFRLKSARFCRQRLCPVCQWRRMLMWRARFFKRLPTILQDHPKARWIFVTLTVKNCPLTDLRTTIQGMSTAWNRFAAYKDFPALGWVRSLEVTRNPETKYAHPHYHVLMMVQPSYFSSKKYLSHQKWRELWQKSARLDYLPVVNVKTIKPHTGDSHPMARGILETIKYGVKESDLLGDAEWLADLTTQMNKLKTIALGGVIKQYLKEDEPEDLIHTDEDPIDAELLDQYPTLLFDWKQTINRYVQNNNVLE
jgi:plasmid rolling circle replication initiator protein Rep